jgi:hypothetical protein
MPHLTEFLQTVVNPPPPGNQSDREPSPQDSDQHEHDNDGPSADSAGEEDSEDIRCSLEFAEACMDYHNIEGSMCDDVRRFSKVRTYNDYP